MRTKAIAGIFILTVIVICFLIYEGYVEKWEDRLMEKAARIHKGMREEEVIEIMGRPNYRGFIDSSRIPMGWNLVWQKEYEDVRKTYSKLLFYNYQKIRYQFPSFKKIIGTVQIDICFSPDEQRVVYISRFYAAE
jgi:hypothetical protein